MFVYSDAIFISFFPSQHYINLPGDKERRIFCDQAGLDHKVFTDTLVKIIEIEEILKDENEIDADLYQEDNLSPADAAFYLKVALYGAFYPNYFLSELKTEGEILKEAGPRIDPSNSIYFGSLPMHTGGGSWAYRDQVSIFWTPFSSTFSFFETLS